jgi:hypothetical protein
MNFIKEFIAIIFSDIKKSFKELHCITAPHNRLAMERSGLPVRVNAVVCL